VTAYETLMVVHPERGPRVKEFIDRFQKIIEAQHGSGVRVEEWGLRDLAYRIEKQSRGYYALFHYQGDGQTVQELERNLKLTDGILRYMTVRADEHAETASASTARSEPAEQDRPAEEPAAAKTEAES
jgi:small subunit ribosomal protein S6